MDAELACIACNVKRTLLSVTPVRNRHEMRSFECPECRTILKLMVARRKPRLFAEGMLDRPVAVAAGR
jgi:hypothetical protein